MLKNLLILISFIFITSCIAKINIDGKPVPGHTYTQINPATNIKTNFLFLRYIIKKEGKETFVTPVYLELNKHELIPTNTDSIYLIVEIVNVLEVSYIIAKKYKMWDGEPYPHEVTQTVSISKQPNRIHQIRLPYKKGVKVEFGLQLFDKNGNFLMDIGEAKYTVEGGDAG